MLTLEPNEKVLLMIRRHWFVFLGPTIMLIVLLIVPPIALVLAPSYLPASSDPRVLPIVNFSLAVYVMVLLTYALVLWMAYYLDVWIITTQRIIDIEQRGLFVRTISEMNMDRIENVVVEIPGFIATLLGFGTIRLETAGEADFTIDVVSDYEQAKDLIVKYSYAEHPLKPEDAGLNAPPPKRS